MRTVSNVIVPALAATRPFAITKAEFDAAKSGLDEVKSLLKELDQKIGQSDCEMDEKIAILRKIAEVFGVDFSDATYRAACLEFGRRP